VTSQVSKIDIPPLALVAVLPVILKAVEPDGLDRAGPRIRSDAPAPETSLLRRHCALIV
jgi:hypothetical protein